MASRSRNIWFRLLGVRLVGYVWMQRISIPRQWEDITLEPGAALDDGVVLLCSGNRRPNKIVIRSGAYINRNTVLDAHLSIEVNRDVMIGPLCFITDADHGMAGSKSAKEQAMEIAEVVIGEGAWLGAGVTVLKGVHIGAGTIVGAGSVVTRDIPAGHIAVGSPARSIGTRSND
jgi:acetyltransferase-like isoleucine patch superfamily enzyme